MRTTTLAILCALALPAGARAETNAELAQQVRQAETAFARSLADRDPKAFAAFVADDAVFFGMGGAVHRGKAAVVAAWQPLFAMEKAPFSWAPAEVHVLDTGTIAHSSGPVMDASGKRFGTFNSVWRREPGGGWKVILDKGCDDCAPCAGGTPAPKPATSTN
jgi:uncharacterized protein (TIGR02246 family)